MIHALGPLAQHDHALVFDRMIHALGPSAQHDHALVFDRMIHALGPSAQHDHAQPISLREASINSRTAPQDLSKAACSVGLSSISTIFSTPPAPMTTGTPTYMSLMPYWPVR